MWGITKLIPWVAVCRCEERRGVLYEVAVAEGHGDDIGGREDRTGVVVCEGIADGGDERTFTAHD